ncbi:G-D-S-L family lipolytic protein [Antarcticibacterium flavum]|uniref:G-D-S-L family lipolytic protein n=1 Tax=Antarcticibacterium flavum TaxID=2058175 RepID=A0A5B7X159_9FLAO|nr:MULTISPECIES: G-D-S-L family lipolytic protein [Antarcticibacterium]MCM4161787.1 G-D-S-L family lipolytic protein [Antarcticibacterium sp. W02-3]QCY68351.1 G-D-S-L family lipolytic protein [Antarcticibacterium flavum]
MKIRNYKWLLLLLAGIVSGCSNDDDNGTGIEEPVEYTSGSADFSHYVAIGNSLTAGYTDGALFRAGQQNSIPNILASRFALAGGGEFTQPLVSDNIGGLLLGGNVITQPRLFFNGATPERVSSAPGTEITNVQAGPFNNLGIPGAKSYHLMAPGYGSVAGVPQGTANPYFARFASSPGTTVLEDALSQDPTFFSLWIGNNDVLLYATAGGAGVNREGDYDPSSYGMNDITDPMIFEQVYTGIVTALTANGAQGVVANIPNVLNVPYFNTVSYKPLSPANESFGPMIPTLNATFAGLNQVFAALGVPERSFVFSETEASAVIIKDESLPDLSQQITGAMQMANVDPATAGLFGLLYGQARQATEDDLLVLPSSSVIGQLNTDAFQMLVNMQVPEATAGQLAINGVTFPLEDEYVLLPSEQQDVLEATTAFNEVIEAVAQQFDLAFVDVNALLDEVAESGVDFDEYTLNARLVFGNAFSLDGIHPTARGGAYLANKFLEAINETYGSNLPPVKAADYTTMYPSSM